MRQTLQPGRFSHFCRKPDGTQSPPIVRISMHTVVLAALAALALAATAIHRPALAQPAAGETRPAPPPPAEMRPAPPQPGEARPAGDLQVYWEVKNRFRLFRRAADFQRHVLAARAGSLLAAEHWLNRNNEGRGWAKDIVEHLCVNAAGALLDTCDRDGERENYLAPKTHQVVVRLTGAVPPGATCNWSFDDGTIPPLQINAACSEPVQPRVRYGKLTVAAVGVTRADNTVESASAEIQVRDLMITGLGDSVAAGEGNPDRPIELDDVGFCFRRFLGSVRSEYFRPSRLGYQGNKACDDNPAGPGASATEDWMKHSARWMSPGCHRSLYGYQLRTALAVAVENPQIAVTYIPLACTGATIESGLLGSQGASECPVTGRCVGTVPGQVGQLRDILAKARQQDVSRAIDLLLLTVGANDIRFSGLVADVIITQGVERVIFNQGGLIASLPQSERVLERELPANFAKLRTALKPMVDGDLGRVVFVSYGHPAMRGEGLCPGGRDGLDIHPAFTADDGRLKRVSEFVQNKFLPTMRALARCEGGPQCADSESMTFVDAHQPAFMEHGFCARSQEDPEFDRECFLSNGKSFETDPVAAATAPLTCSRRPNEFRPYAARARWIRSANDSYFTAMTFPRAQSSMAQPSNIHDPAWAAMSAVYGGAFHPSAEGHAAMADAALPAAREVLGLKPPPQFEVQPLAPPATAAKP
jgi:lysophospholipase L1-like esterase